MHILLMWGLLVRSSIEHHVVCRTPSYNRIVTTAQPWREESR